MRFFFLFLYSACHLGLMDSGRESKHNMFLKLFWDVNFSKFWDVEALLLQKFKLENLSMKIWWNLVFKSILWLNCWFFSDGWLPNII